MGKVAALAGAALGAGLGAFGALAGLIPLHWAEAAGLVLTGSALIGASLMLEGSEAKERAAPVGPVRVEPAQEAEA